MACCCKPTKCRGKSAAACLGRCDLPKHRCLYKEDVKPGPVPKHMGWLYTAKDAPAFQLRCGWRPGHILCPVLKKIEQHNSCVRGEGCSVTCGGPCLSRRPCGVHTPRCIGMCPSVASSCCKPPPTGLQPLIRVVRHAGEYTICTKPSNVSNAPHGQFPLKYVLNTDGCDECNKAKFSVEAKYNDYLFDYTSSQTSFVLDFSPPEQKCLRACAKRSVVCM